MGWGRGGNRPGHGGWHDAGCNVGGAGTAVSAGSRAHSLPKALCSKHAAFPLAHPPRYFNLEQGNTAEQQEKADAAAAQAHFVQLGWAAEDLCPSPGDESAACDELLGALLKRAAALQEARQRGKPGVDWEQPEWR